MGPEEYIPASPRYVRDSEDDADGQDTDGDEDVEAPFLAPKDSHQGTSLCTPIFGHPGKPSHLLLNRSGEL